MKLTWRQHQTIYFALINLRDVAVVLAVIGGWALVAMLLVA